MSNSYLRDMEYKSAIDISKNLLGGSDDLGNPVQDNLQDSLQSSDLRNVETLVC